jgi:tetratricopeptide (TPR) repeat protein
VADALYKSNKFEEAILEYNKIKQLQIKNNRYHTMINNALKRLAISYLATGNQNLACENFKLAGDITDFTVRNYLLDFCTE